MNKVIAAVMLAAFAFSSPIAFADQDPTYPFKVTIGGQEAVKENPAAAFAVIKEAVAADSEIQIAAEGQVIVNAVQCDDSGTPIAGKATAVLMFEGPKGSLAKTLDGKKLEAGKYLANIVANGGTSRVVFNVK